MKQSYDLILKIGIIVCLTLNSRRSHGSMVWSPFPSSIVDMAENFIQNPTRPDPTQPKNKRIRCETIPNQFQYYQVGLGIYPIPKINKSIPFWFYASSAVLQEQFQLLSRVSSSSLHPNHAPTQQQVDNVTPDRDQLQAKIITNLGVHVLMGQQVYWVHVLVVEEAELGGVGLHFLEIARHTLSRTPHFSILIWSPIEP